MKYLGTDMYENLLESTSLVAYDKKYRIEEFDCGIEDYNNFLINDAEFYISAQISSVHLLIENESQEILGYIALLTDSFALHDDEKKSAGLFDVPFNTVPALKIGKLATSKKHKGRKLGSFLLFLSLGFAMDLLERGIACRFLTVDADIEFDVDTPKFYLENNFEFNEHKQYSKRKQNRSMRYDLYSE